MHRFPKLFSPIGLRGHEIRNRILSTGHQTWLARANRPSDEMIAYHEARAGGGAGLIIVESARFHVSSFTDAPDLHIDTDDAIPTFRALAQAVHRHGAHIFGQLSHAGRVSRGMRTKIRLTLNDSRIEPTMLHTGDKSLSVSGLTHDPIQSMPSIMTS